MKKVNLLLTISLMFFGLAANAKMNADQCAEQVRAEVKGISDSKKKSAEFKEKFQKCLTKNGLPASLAFSGKYKP